MRLSGSSERGDSIVVVHISSSSGKWYRRIWKRIRRVSEDNASSFCARLWDEVSSKTDLSRRVVLPIMIRNLINQVGFGWTVRAIALVQLVLLSSANLLLRVPQKPKNRRRLLDLASLKDWPYIFFVLACFVVFLGMFTPFFYVQSFAIESGIASENVGFYIVPAMNAGSIPGRILPALLAQYLGPLNMIIGATVALGACGFGFLGTNALASVYVVAIMYGFFSGLFFAMQPTIFVRLTSDMAVVGTRFGMAFTVMSVALLFGSPIGGAVQGPGGYDASWIYVGVAAFAGSAVMCTARVLKVGWAPLARV